MLGWTAETRIVKLSLSCHLQVCEKHFSPDDILREVCNKQGTKAERDVYAYLCTLKHALFFIIRTFGTQITGVPIEYKSRHMSRTVGVDVMRSSQQGSAYIALFVCEANEGLHVITTGSLLNVCRAFMHVHFVKYHAIELTFSCIQYMAAHLYSSRTYFTSYRFWYKSG